MNKYQEIVQKKGAVPGWSPAYKPEVNKAFIQSVVDIELATDFLVSLVFRYSYKTLYSL